MKALLTIVGFLGILTRIHGFTVERSGAFGPMNWPDATLDSDRRTSIEMLLNGKMFSADLDNILRESEIPKSMKEEKCSSTSEESQRAKRSEEILANGTLLSISESVVSDFAEGTTEKSNKTHNRNIESVVSDFTKGTTEKSNRTHNRNIESIVSDFTKSTTEKSNRTHNRNIESVVSDFAKGLTEKSNKTHNRNIESVDSDFTKGTTEKSNKTHNRNIEAVLLNAKEETVESSSKIHPTSVESFVSKLREFTKKPHIISHESNFSKSTIESLTKVHLTSSESKKSIVSSSSSPEMETSFVTLANTSDRKAPRNVVLMLIDAAGIGRETMWKNFATSHKFAVQGYLQNCLSGELRKFSSSESGISGWDECDCDRFLRYNVESLLSWARQAREMNTATVSATNFTIPAPFVSEKPTMELKEFDDNEEANSLKQEVPRFRPDNRNSWNILNLEKTSTPPAKQEGINGYDGMWDVFDMFSRIRIAFFRILLESLGNMSGSEDESAGRRVFAVQPSIVELITDALKDIKSVTNDKGFMLVASAPGNEMSSAVEVLQREISANDTLLVVVGICSKNNERIPFFADGPGAEKLREARAVFNLPMLIRNSMSSGCPDEICNNERRVEPVALPTLQIRSLAENLPHKRVIRAKEDEETSEPTAEEKSTKESTVEETEESKSTPVIGKRSGNGAEKMKIDALTGILGIATSIAAMLTLNA